VVAGKNEALTSAGDGGSLERQARRDI
jgi:hypothetical protein